MPPLFRPARTAAWCLLLSFLTGCATQISGATATAEPFDSPSAATAPPMQTMTPEPRPTASLSPQPSPTRAEPQARDTLLLAHVMPWYQTQAFSGAWGWHWTMDHFDPDQGQIASNTVPLTGPYDSSDPDLLEYQVLLMKLSGIDGVIVDWYGSADFWDYAGIHRATQALFEAARKAGLMFAVCYEDQTLKHMLDNQHLQAGEDIAQAQADLRVLREWFSDPAYLRHEDRPVLLVFGPQHFKDGEQWEQVFSGLDPVPYLVSEDTIVWGAAASSYPWPPMWKASGGVLAEKALADYLNEFYLRAAEQPYRLGGAFPGFDDVYKEAGVSAGYGVLDPRGGDTLRETLKTAVETNPDAIQLITWNDYGEGTTLEPTEEYGTLYLEILQEFRRQEIEPGFSPVADDLGLPLQLFNLRKQHPGDAAVQAKLDLVFAAIASGDLDAARELLAEVP